ncbi:hypothetical protein MIND_00491100 [Mycena indigotica]|uniref:Uncharacterized protein n=1 Tax=Mycena indigotica TaxID=2126181 RepID=A0A8H6SXB0_9AGAR|nr:uncharacterized protein MIND_00491100 [Mycena indigotica]KAF7306983.1 hypothetical protein MIND_00491100 [Mycena indigotica]
MALFTGHEDRRFLSAPQEPGYSVFADLSPTLLPTYDIDPFNEASSGVSDNFAYSNLSLNHSFDVPLNCDFDLAALNITIPAELQYLLLPDHEPLLQPPHDATVDSDLLAEGDQSTPASSPNSETANANAMTPDNALFPTDPSSPTPDQKATCIHFPSPEKISLHEKNRLHLEGLERYTHHLLDVCQKNNVQPVPCQQQVQHYDLSRDALKTMLLYLETEQQSLKRQIKEEQIRSERLDLRLAMLH